MKRLDDISAIELGFPHKFLSSPTVQEMAFGGALKTIDNLSDAAKKASGIKG